MPRSTEPLTRVSRPGNTNRAYGPHLIQRQYAHWKRQMAVYAAAARRQAGRRAL